MQLEDYSATFQSDKHSGTGWAWQGREEAMEWRAQPQGRYLDVTAKSQLLFSSDAAISL